MPPKTEDPWMEKKIKPMPSMGLAVLNWGPKWIDAWLVDMVKSPSVMLN